MVKTWSSMEIASGFINETETLDVNKFKKIENFSFTGMQSEIVPNTNCSAINLSTSSSNYGAKKYTNMKWILSGSNSYAAFKLGGISSSSKTIMIKFTLASDASLNATSIIGAIWANASKKYECYIYLNNCSKIKLGIEYTLLLNGYSGKATILEDGNVLIRDIDYIFTTGVAPSSTNFKNNCSFVFWSHGTYSFSDISIDLNVPDVYEIKYINSAFRKDNSIYVVINDTFTKLTDNYPSLSDAEKKVLFRQIPERPPSIAEIMELEKFSILTYSEQIKPISFRVIAVPKDQLTLPRNLIGIDSFEGINGVTLTTNISANAKCKFLTTTDLATYQTYDFFNQQWQTIDHTDLGQVINNGIDVTQLFNIPRSSWAMLAKRKAGIGFAYLLSIENSTDTCNVDKLELTVNMKGSWNKAFING